MPNVDVYTINYMPLMAANCELCAQWQQTVNYMPLQFLVEVPNVDVYTV